MINDIESLLSNSLIIIFSFLMYAFIYKKYYKAIYDPLFFNIVINFSFSTALMFIVNAKNTYFIIEFLIFQVSFYFGFVITHNFFPKNKLSGTNEMVVNFKSVNLLSWLTMIVFFLVIITNLIILQTKGFALTSQNPTSSKVESFSEGFGIFRRFLWGVGNISIMGSIVLILINYKRVLFTYVVILQALFGALGGAKSALLLYVFYTFIFIYHPLFRNMEYSKKLKKYLPFFFICAFLVALLVLYIENNEYSKALFALVNRLLYSGDAVIYYYDPSIYKYFEHYNFLTYVYNCINPILGFFRLARYTEPTGYKMVYEYMGGELPFSTVLGPNTPFYIVADMYFGPIIGFFYSFFIGCVIAYGKNLFFKKELNLLKLVLRAWFYMISFVLIIEAPLFFSRVFDFVIFFIPIFVFLYILTYNFRRREHAK